MNCIFFLSLFLSLFGILQENFCSIHRTDVDDSFVSLKKEETWETLKRAENIKNCHFDNLVFEQEHQLPTTFYHQSCYQHFTMK